MVPSPLVPDPESRNAVLGSRPGVASVYGVNYPKQIQPLFFILINLTQSKSDDNLFLDLFVLKKSAGYQELMEENPTMGNEG